MPAATIDTELGPIREPDSEASPKKTMKFTYSNGSTPLDGYTIKRGIGTGGFGEVYFAVTPAGKEVALKRIQRNLDIELRGVAHCLNLKHPNLLQLFDVRRDEDGEAWVVMEYIAGSNLRELLDQHPAGLDRQAVDHWFGQLAAAVAHLHANGIVHRDLKPANVFEDQGIIKLGDYGLSKFISCSRRGGHTESVGTFHYMAPEIGRGEYGKEIDVYALGIILYELLTGRVPFEGESGHEIVMKHLTAQPDLSIVPEPYRQVVAQALAKSPQARQPSVADMLAPIGLSLDQQGLVRRETTMTVLPKSQPFNPSPSQTVPDYYQGNAQSANAAPEEPVYRAIRTSASHVRQWWQSLEQNPLLRFAVLLGAVTLLLINSSWLGPVISMLVLMYLPYYIIRQIVLDSSPQPGPTLYTSSVAGMGTSPARMPRKQWLHLARHDLGRKSKLLRGAELSSSGAVATVGLAVAYGIAALIYSRHGDTQLATLAPLMWSGCVALCGTWMTLFIGKLCEPRDGTGEGLVRRLMLLAGGAVVGVIAFCLADYLELINNADFALNETRERFRESLSNNSTYLYRDGHPMVGAYALHFGLLFALLRWWRPSDPLRRSRLSLWSIAVAVVASWFMQQFIPIPHPWGMITIGAMAAILQISAPWVSPAARVVT